MINIGFVSLGCAKNLVDTEIMLGLLKREGYRVEPDSEKCEVIIVNTCSFIESAKQESIDSIIEMGEQKTKRCKLLIVTGCLAERYRDEILKELPEVNAVVGTGNIHEIAGVIQKAFEGERVTAFGETLPEGLPRLRATPGYTAYLRIADGCDNHCSYCVIPSIRGGYRSRAMEDIIAEASELAADGVKELIVIAQDTTGYGIDLYGEPRLCLLLEELCRLDVSWIRLHYLYPERIDDRLIDVIAEQEKIVKYLDIPIQHCNNEILTRMNRSETKEGLTALFRDLRERIPECALRTTVIVGFPGETQRQFEELLDFISESRFERLGVFSYSQEEDTPAALLPDQLDEDVKQEREQRIMETQKGINDAANALLVGQTLTVLIEGRDAEWYYGRSYRDSIDIDPKVFFKGRPGHVPGDFAAVRVNGFIDYELTGDELI